MKKLVLICLVLSLISLCACKNNDKVTEPSNSPEATQGPTTDNNQPTDIEGGSVNQPDNDSEFETPIDVDDSFLNQDNGTEPSTTPTDPTEPSKPGDPSEPTEPKPTESPVVPTEPTTPPSGGNNGGQTGSKPIELPMIPG